MNVHLNLDGSSIIVDVYAHSYLVILYISKETIVYVHNIHICVAV